MASGACVVSAPTEPFEGIQPGDRAAVEVLNEVSNAIVTATAAVKADPALGRLIAERSPQLADLVPDVVRVALRTVVPPILDEHEADRAQWRTHLEAAHSALEALLLSSESEVAKVTAARDRAVREAERLEEIKHAHWEVAQRLRAAFAVALAQRDAAVAEGRLIVAAELERLADLILPASAVPADDCPKTDDYAEGLFEGRAEAAGPLRRRAAELRTGAAELQNDEGQWVHEGGDSRV